MNWLGVAIFGVTYVLISARRLSWLALDRPAAALLGATACVALGVLDPAQALAAVNGPTLLLLLGVMGMGAYLAVDGFFERCDVGNRGHRSRSWRFAPVRSAPARCGPGYPARGRSLIRAPSPRAPRARRPRSR